MREYVLYWAQMNRRMDCNHALAYAVGLANELKLPVLFTRASPAPILTPTIVFTRSCWRACRKPPGGCGSCGIGYCFYLRAAKPDPNDVLYRLAARPRQWSRTTIRLSSRARHNASRAGQTRHRLLRGGFQLHRADEPVAEARVRGLHDSAEDPQAARRVPAAGRIAAGVPQVDAGTRRSFTRR